MCWKFWRKNKASDWLCLIEDAVKILKREEGWRRYIYDDATGAPLLKGMTLQGNATVGWGFTWLPNEAVPHDMWLRFPKWADMGLALHVKKIVEDSLPRFGEYLPHLNHAQIVVLVCMIYQLGVQSTLSFKRMWRAALEDDFREMGVQMMDSLWHEQTPERCERMAKIMERGKL